MQIETRFPPQDQAPAWTEAGRQWLAALCAAFRRDDDVVESDHFLAIVLSRVESPQRLLRFAEHCRITLLSVMKDLADFDAPGKQVIVCLPTAADYYRYISLYLPEGEYGGSGGMHIRSPYPHIAVYGNQLEMLQSSVG